MTKPRVKYRGKRKFVYHSRAGRYIEVEEIPSSNVTKIRRAREETFVKMPLQWAAKAAAATNSKRAMVWTWLLYQSWRTKGKTFPVPNDALTGFGISRETKRRTLQHLEKAGLITVKRQAYKSPIVTIRGRL
jgi:hypothetical protein